MTIVLTPQMVLKYLGYKGQDISSLMELTEQTIAEIYQISSPKFLVDYQKILTNEENLITLKNGLLLQGNSISKRLANCHMAAILIATIGLEFDKKLLSLQHIQPSKAIIFDAAGSAYVEAIMDKLNERIINENPQMHTTKRFSAGFGDLPLQTNKQLIKKYDAYRRLGIVINQNFLMSPCKSVTAIIGIRNKE